MIVVTEDEMDSVEKIKLFVKNNKLLSEGDRVVAGISGGADSVCLLLLLSAILSPQNIIAVHINHGIRGEEATRDEEFVKELCERHNILLEVRQLNVPAYAKENKFSEEEAGRILRYEVFEEIRKQNKADKIAVAHNMNDVAETFLINLSRGSGITGLAGIKIRNGNIIRPLLKTNRKEIEEIVAGYGEGYVTDSTNKSLIYTRNRIRNKVLPELSRVNEGAIRHISEVADRLCSIENYILKEAEKAYGKYVDETKDIVVKKDILELDEVLVDEVLHRVLVKRAGRARDIGSVHIAYVRELFLKQVGREINLPYAVRVVREYEGIRFLKEDKMTSVSCDDLKMPELRLDLLEIDEVSDVLAEENNIKLTFYDGSTKNLMQNSCIKWFDYDKISNDVLLRYRQDGDYIIISENGAKKKLKKYFIDSKVPSEKRNVIPVVASDSDILWIIGYRTGEGAKITSTTRKLLKIEIILK